MSQATFSVRMDEKLKEQFELLCNDFGMNMSTAINVFAKAVVRERRIPFVIASSDTDITKEKAMEAFSAIRAKATNDFPEEMSLSEINDEISNSRNNKTK